MCAEMMVSQSRRAVLAAAAGAAAATVVASIARPVPALAGTDGDVVLGTENSSATPTTIRLTGPDGAALLLESESANGLEATAGGIAVAGTSRGGYGIAGTTADGIAVRADAHPFETPSRGSSGFALVANGRVRFSRSGRATIQAGRSYVDLTVAGGLGRSPLLFANLLNYRPGVYVAAVRPNVPTTGKLRIQLNKPVTRRAVAAWLVLESYVPEV